MRINFNKTKLYKVVSQIEDLPETNLPEVVLAGRSNVGKSSLLNALTNQKKLAKVSKSPGKTRKIFYYLVDDKFLLTDIPGYGYAKVEKRKQSRFNQLTDNYLASNRNIALVLFLLDSRHKPSKHDEMMFEFLVQSQLPYAIVLSKTDKLSRNELNQQIQKFRANPYIGEDGAIFPISSLKADGIKDLRAFLADYINAL